MANQRYISEYNKNTYHSFLMRIPKNNQEIMEKMESVPSKNGYLLSLIKEDLHPSILKLGYIKKVLKEILGRHGIQKIYLFGSYARGEAKRESDVDILCDKGDISTLVQKGLLEEELEEKLGKKVDLIFITSSMPAYFKEKIQEDLIELC